MDPVNAELELIVQGDVVNFGFEVNLAVNTFLDTAKVCFGTFEGRRPVSDLQNPRCHVHRHRIPSDRGENEAQLVFELLPKIDHIIAAQIHRGTATPAGRAAGAAPALAPTATATLATLTAAASTCCATA